MLRQHTSGGKELHGGTACCAISNGFFYYYIYKVVVYMAYSCTTNESELCHPRCVFTLLEGVNIHQKHNYNMAKMVVFIAEQNKKKLHV